MCRTHTEKKVLYIYLEYTRYTLCKKQKIRRWSVGERPISRFSCPFLEQASALSLWYINLAPSHTHNSWLLFSPPCRHWFVKKTFFITFWRKTFDCNWPKSLLTYNFSVIQLWSRRPGLLIVMNVLRLLSERSRKVSNVFSLLELIPQHLTGITRDGLLLDC